MHILMTDHLTCPRCGPEFGLILLADRIEDRRILEGRLGCANCRETYPVRAGFGDLRPRPAGALPDPETAPEPADREEALRLAALMGVAEGPGFTLVVGPGARLAPGMSRLVEDVEVIAADPSLVGWSEEDGVSRIAVASALPLATGRMRAVALTGSAADDLLTEGIRAVAPASRLVLDPAPADAEERLEARGFAIVASQDDTVVAAPA